jgi:hypothetical protein
MQPDISVGDGDRRCADRSPCSSPREDTSSHGVPASGAALMVGDHSMSHAFGGQSPRRGPGGDCHGRFSPRVSNELAPLRGAFSFIHPTLGRNGALPLKAGPPKARGVLSTLGTVVNLERGEHCPHVLASDGPVSCGVVFQTKAAKSPQMALELLVRAKCPRQLALPSALSNSKAVGSGLHTPCRKLEGERG